MVRTATADHWPAARPASTLSVNNRRVAGRRWQRHRPQSELSLPSKYSNKPGVDRPPTDRPTDPPLPSRMFESERLERKIGQLWVCGWVGRRIVRDQPAIVLATMTDHGVAERRFVDERQNMVKQPPGHRLVGSTVPLLSAALIGTRHLTMTVFNAAIIPSTNLCHVGNQPGPTDRRVALVCYTRCGSLARSLRIEQCNSGSRSADAGRVCVWGRVRRVIVPVALADEDFLSVGW